MPRVNSRQQPPVLRFVCIFQRLANAFERSLSVPARVLADAFFYFAVLNHALEQASACHQDQVFLLFPQNPGGICFLFRKVKRTIVEMQQAAVQVYCSGAAVIQMCFVDERRFVQMRECEVPYTFELVTVVRLGRRR